MARLKPKSKVRGASSKQLVPSRSFAWNKLVPALLLLLLLVVSAGFYQGLSVLLSQPVTRVVVNGELRHVDQQTIVDQVQPFLVDGFVMLDLDAIRQQLLQHPWIFGVTLTRRWPDQVQIAVIEQTPIAQWGDSAYLNHRGELFEPSLGLKSRGLDSKDLKSRAINSGANNLGPINLEEVNSTALKVAANLPRLHGPDHSAEQVMNHFRELGEALSQEHLSLDQLMLNDRGNWSARLDSGVSIKLGEGEVMEKMQRFLLAYQLGLSADFARVETIDMRYSNGFAVAWKTTNKQG